MGLSHGEPKLRTQLLSRAVVDHGKDCLFIAANVTYTYLRKKSALINFPLISVVFNKKLENFHAIVLILGLFLYFHSRLDPI
jgi:hypothetical protein